MQITIKLEGIKSFSDMSVEKARKVIEAGEKVEREHISKVLTSARAKIRHRTGHFSTLLKGKIDGKGKSYVVAQIGTLGASAEDAKAFNAYENGHAKPNDAGGVKIVMGAHVLKKAIEEDRSPFKNDMKSGIQKAIEG